MTPLASARNRPLLAGLALVLVLALGSCGDDAGSGATTTTAPTATSTTNGALSPGNESIGHDQ